MYISIKHLFHSLLAFSSGIVLGTLSVLIWNKLSKPMATKFYFLREKNKNCQLCLIKQQPYMCDNNFCSYDLILKIVSHLYEAKTYIYVCNPFLEVKEICLALVAAFSRGVDVRVINSSLNRPHQTTMSCLAAGIPFKSLDIVSIMMHNKFLIIDDELLLRGSLNFTINSLTGNFENIQVVCSPNSVLWYHRYFKEMWNDQFPGHPSSAITEKLIKK